MNSVVAHTRKAVIEHECSVDVIVKGSGTPPTDCTPVHIHFGEMSPDESYTLEVEPHGILLEAEGPAGGYYGLQTLLQLLRFYGSSLPACRIEDSPAFPNRGYYLDITRGRVPKLERLLDLVDRLAALKVNQLQLYFEHVFDFQFDPDIAGGCSPLNASELLALDAYCQERHIELVPSLTCFGHMGRVLSLPAYRHLAERPWKHASWEKATWRARLHGATINPAMPESRELLTRMLDEFLPLFTSSQFNLCGDETYDLGYTSLGENATDAARAELYIHHLQFLREIAQRHGKTLMCWGDMLLKFPDVLDKLPSDCTVLDWGYSSRTHFEKGRPLIEAGADIYVCPSVVGYQTVFNRIEEARANIAGYARAGIREGAIGLLNTDWGDLGHFNMPACSLHGLALGAAMSWNPDASAGEAFDDAFAHQVLGDPNSPAFQLFRSGDRHPLTSWPLMYLETPEIDRSEISNAQQAHDDFNVVAEALRLSRGTHALLATHEEEELALAARAIALNALRVLVDSGKASSTALSDGLARFARDYAATWRTSCKEGRCCEIVAAIEQRARTLRLSDSEQ
jgi:hypothetical protein